MCATDTGWYAMDSTALYEGCNCNSGNYLFTTDTK